jgi:hypothetical protein
MASVTMQIPDEVLESLKSRGYAPSETLRLAAAFSLCSRGELATSLAARLAGLAYADFLEAAARAELFPVNFEEIQEAINRGDTLGRQRVASDPVGQGGSI